MNSIYRVIFNHATKTWTAVSELAKGRTKIKSERTGRTSIQRTVLSLSILASLSMSHTVYGATVLNNGTLSRPSTNPGAIEISDNGTSSQRVLIGSEIKTGGIVAESGDANQHQLVAIGNNINVQGRGAVAIGGDDAGSARGLGEIAGINFQTAATESGNFNGSGYRSLTVYGQGAVGIGTFAVSNGKGATAVGLGSTASVEGSTAVGTLSFATGSGSTAFGLAARSSGSNTLAVGSGARAELAGSVALGAGSVASQGVEVTAAGQQYNINGQTYDSTTKSNFDVSNVVSVGNETVKRQIQNVAPGQITATSTDAINGAQLYDITKGVQTIINNHVQNINQSINNSGFHLKNNNTQVKDINKDDSLNFNNGTHTTATVSAAGDVQINVNTQNINVRNGVPSTTGAAGLTTAQTVVDAIKGSGFNLQANALNGSIVKPGDVVNFVDGNNVQIEKSGNTITINAKDTSASVSNTTGSPVTVTKGTEANGVTDFVVDLTTQAKTSLAKADSAVQEIETQIDGTKVKTVKQGDNAANFITGDNIELTNDNGAIKVATKKDVSFTNVNTGTLSTTGTATIGGMLSANGGLTVAGGQTVNMGNNVITNVASGGDTGTNAANIDDVKRLSAAADTTASTSGTNGIEIVKTTVNGKTTDYQVGLTKAIRDEIAKGQEALEAFSQGMYAFDGDNSTTTDLIPAGSNITFTGGSNIITTATAEAGIEIALKPNIVVDNVTVGTVKISQENGINAGDKRIQGVADGTADNDAVNLSQLNATKNAINSEIAKGFNITSDSGVLISRQLGDTVAITGGNGTGTFSAGNVKTVNTANGVQVQFSENPEFSSVKTGDNLLNGQGLTIGTASISNASGINAGNKTVKGVANATANDEAVNLSQLKAQSVSVKAGQNINSVNEVKTADGISYTIDAKDTSASVSNATGSPVTVTKGTEANGVTDFVVDLTTQAKTSLAKADSAVQDVKGQGGITASKGDDNIVTVDLDNATKANLTKADTAVQNIVNKVNGQAVNTLTKTANEQDFVNGDNIVISDDNGAIKVATKKDVLFTNVNTGTLSTTGTATIGGMLSANGGLTVAGGQTVNMGNNVITNVASGGDTGTNAANIDDVKRLSAAADTTASTSGTNGIEIVKTTVNGKTTDYQVGLTEETRNDIAKGVDAKTAVDKGFNITSDSGVLISRQLGDTVAITGGNGAGTFSAGNVKTVNTANGVQVQFSENPEFSSVKTGDNLLNGQGLTIGTASISNAGGINAGNKTVKGVANATANDEAVNLSQLKARSVSVKAGQNINSVNEVKTADGISYTIDAKDTSASVSNATGSPVTVTKGTEANGVTDFVVDLTTQAKTSLAKADSAVQDVKGQGGITASKGDDNIVTVDLDNATKANLTKADTAVQTIVNKVNGQAVNTLTKTANEQDFVNGDNIVISDDNGAIKVATKKDVSFTNVNTGTLSTTGTATIGGMLSANGGLTVAGGQTVNMGNNVITNVASGGDTGTNAANIDDVKRLSAAADTTASTSGTNGIEIVKTTVNGKTTDYQVGLTEETRNDIAKGVDAKTAVDKGFNITSDSGVLISRQLGDTVAITGGNGTGTFSAGNVKTVNTANGVQVQFSENPEFSSVKTGDNLLNGQGLTIGTASISNAGGINAGNKTVKGVANATANDEAVNLSQLKARSVSVKAGQNVNSVNEVKTADGISYTIDAKDTIVSAVQGSPVTVSKGAETNGVTDYAVDLSEQAKASLAKADTAVQDVKGQGGITATKGDDNIVTVDLDNATKANLTKADTAVQNIVNKVNGQAVNTLTKTANEQDFVNGDNIVISDDNGAIKVSTAKQVTFDKATIGTASIDKDAGINAGDKRIQGVADGTADNDAVNLSQLNATKNAINSEIAKGFNITSDSGVLISRQLGDTVAITGGNGTGTFSASNVKTVNTANGVQVQFSENPEFSSVKTGDNLLNGQGLTIGTASISNAGGINAGNKTVKGVANATANDEAVNLSQLNATKVSVKAGQNINSVNEVKTADGISYTIDAKDTTVSAVQGSPVTVSKGAEANGVTDYVVDLTEQAKASLAKADTAVQEIKTTVNGQAVKTLNQTNNTQDFVNGDNIEITNDNGAIKVATKKDVSFTNVNTGTLSTTGTATIGGMLNANGGLTVAGGQTVNMGNNVITNVASGGDTGTNAANIDDVKRLAAAADTTASTSGTNGIEVLKVEQNGQVTDYQVGLTEATRNDIAKGVQASDDVANKGLTFTGDTGATTAKKLGDSLAITGDDNISTTATADGVAIRLNRNLTADSLNIGNVSINNAGINAGNQVVSNVANGVADSDAVNVAQLKANSVKVVAGANISSVTSEVTPSGTTYTINAKDTSASVSTASNALTVKAGNENNGVIDYAIDLSDGTKASLAKADTALQTVNGTDGIIASKQGDTVTVALDDNTKASLAKAGSAVQEIKTTVNGQEVKTLNQADNTQNFVDGDNIELSNDNGAIKVATKKDVTFTNVNTATLSTTGNAQIGGMLNANGGLTVANEQTVDMGNNRIQGVANGVENSDAVNVAQLNNATTILNQAINATGWTLKANGDSGAKIANNGTVDIIQGRNLEVSREGSNLTIKTVDNPSFASVTADKVETKDLNASGNITLGSANSQVTIANGANVDLGNNVINGVADGDISPNSKQAVNGGQVAQLFSGEATLSTPDVTLSNGKTITQIVAIDSDGKAYSLTTYNAKGRGEVLNNSVISAIHNMNEQGIKFFHTNDGTVQEEAQKTNSVDSQANGAYSTAVGYQASAEGTGSLAIGQSAEVKGEGSVSVGAENSVNADNAGAVGRRNHINGIGSYVTGSNNRVDTKDTYVFGSGVTQTAANSIFLGNDSGYVEESRTTKGNKANEEQKIAGQTYHYAGGKAEEVVGVVSVGNVDERGVQQTRRIQNVAPGLISAESTDAVNGSQLHSVVSNLNQNLNAGYNALNRRIHTVDRHLRSGVAGAVATASLVQAYNPSDSLLAVGGGTYRGASALALGYSKVSDNGKIIFKLTGSVNNAGHYTGGASIGYRF